MNPKHVKRSGNILFIMMEDGSQRKAVPTTTKGVWVVNNSSGPGPDPDGDYSWPYSLDYVTSEYGPRGSGFHEGMDWSGGPATTGDPIPSIGDGTVHDVNSSGGFGNYCIIFHGTFDGWEWYSLYAHMSTAPVVSEGASVTKGQTLGPIGNTGNSFGAHLHMEIHRVPIGGNISWANNNPSWGAPRTAIQPRDFMNTYGDGGAIYS